MKDLYSFDKSQEDAYASYDQVGEAYRRIFQRIGVPFVVADADSGNMGGSKSHEYHLISPVGEDTLLTCSHCGYTANQELAVGHYKRDDENPVSTLEEHPFLNSIIPANARTHIRSTVVTFQSSSGDVNQGWAAILTPMDRLPNLLKIQTQLNQYLATAVDVHELSSAKLNTIDPDTISHLHLFVDDAVQVPPLLDTNRVTLHPPSLFRLTKAGDTCLSCQEESGARLSSVKAIECGHTFYLGTRYSADLGCKFRDIDGTWKEVEMGCYGIGITRLLAAVAEACHDDRGLVWPSSIAPYRVCIVTTTEREEEAALRNQVYDALDKIHKGDVMIDDRLKTGFGAKMKDAELMGYPFIVVIGSKSIHHDRIELHERIQNSENRKSMVTLEELINKTM
ncbi:uncharacterized protein BX663DRAFT_253298 [Cokeromyces recurvatus]|uniref:uncharacterized protein n=1 Tax=Cokeromyces recurvatus TaxID=90255 RepID=UPI00221F39E9|nr:uncharacterized protein BX663DRAFT_253298 [Cokeromyces recurvatus]KAI7906142.1 hypothetical protein BX663DRAFT_253298 [Cokeromyces recurvatus]